MKLFIFLKVAYFYDTREKRMKRPLISEFGVRIAELR